MLELRKCLLHFRFLSQKELDWNGGRQVRVVAWEPNWDVHCHDIVSWLEALRQQRADCTVTAHHLHFEKRIETVLPATRVVRKFIVGSLSEAKISSTALTQKRFGCCLRRRGRRITPSRLAETSCATTWRGCSFRICLGTSLQLLPRGEQ